MKSLGDYWGYVWYDPILNEMYVTMYSKIQLNTKNLYWIFLGDL